LKKAVIIYWSKSGNTEKVALAVERGLNPAGIDVKIRKPEESEDIDYFDYDLVCIGFPSYQWHPPRPMDEMLKTKMRQYRKQGKVKVSAPVVPGKYAFIFCTYSGPHTGLNEAIPAGKYAGQFFEHIGFTVLDELYVLSEFHGSEKASTKGRMGDIRGLPTEDDLNKIEADVTKMVEELK
jgi:hypothetical protein